MRERTAVSINVGAPAPAQRKRSSTGAMSRSAFVLSLLCALAAAMSAVTSGDLVVLKYDVASADDPVYSDESHEPPEQNSLLANADESKDTTFLQKGDPNNFWELTNCPPPPACPPAPSCPPTPKCPLFPPLLPQCPPPPPCPVRPALECPPPPPPPQPPRSKCGAAPPPRCTFSRQGQGCLQLLPMGYHRLPALPGQRSAYKLHARAADWPSARRRCEEEGALLAVPNSELEARALAALLLAAPPPEDLEHFQPEKSRNHMHVGVTRALDGRWRTVTGELLEESGYFKNPGNSDPSSGENCVQMYTDLDYIDYFCHRKLMFVCELPLE